MSNSIEKTLQDIKNSLDEIKSLIKLVNQDKLQESKKKLLKEGTIKLQIYELCDGTRTIKDIAEKIQKSPDYISSYLTILKREGLIRTIERDGKQFYEQIF
ncbi:MAG: winged helix-turn-helix domain-containing protein [Nitrososphaeria archaeon]